ncbi:MAG: hypothetical protein ACR2H9_03835, partial [Longimicrobiaceae bacterium]
MKGVFAAFVCVLASATVVVPGPTAVHAQEPRPAADTVPRRDTAVVAQRPQRPRERHSMVGYIEDATVSSKLRLRFEAAFHNEVPDRAEFFYAKCGCYRDPDLDPADHDPEAPGPGPGIPSHVDFQQLYLSGEYAASERLSAFAQVPLRWIQPQFPAGTDGFDEAVGLGDLRAGLKLGLIAETDRLVTLQVQAHLPTGDPAK